MTADFAEIHDELRAIARDLLGKAGPCGDVEWHGLAEPGWLGLEVPDALGGAGATFAEVAVVLEELGRAATRTAYLGGAVLGVGALSLIEPNPRRDGLLRETASGDAVAAVALADGDDAVSAAPPFRVERSRDGLRVHGSASFVPDATEADRLLLLALDADSTPVLVDVDPHVPGLSRSEQPVLDETRRFAHVSAADVAVGEESVLIFARDADAAVRLLLDRAAVAVACDSLGLADGMLAATVGYAGMRTQFGRPIGSFQAVKHMCADMLVRVTVSRRLVADAVRSVAAAEPDASVAVSMAKSYACAAAVEVVGAAMQLHGGVGYTWESGVHAYLKRATLNRSLFGTPSAHRRQLARRYP